MYNEGRVRQISRFGPAWYPITANIHCPNTCESQRELSEPPSSSYRQRRSTLRLLLRGRHDQGRQALKQRWCKCVSQLSAPAELCQASRQARIDVKVLPPPWWPWSKGGQAGHAEGPGCDGYLSGRVTASGKEVGGVGQPESPPSPPCLFTVGATVSPGDLCLCTPCPPVPPPATQTHSRETKNPHQLLPPIQSPRDTCLLHKHTHTHRQVQTKRL